MNTDSVSTPLSGVERKILLSVPLAILATAISIFGIFYYQVTMGVSHIGAGALRVAIFPI